MFAAAGFAQNAVWESSITSFDATDLFDQNSPAAMDKDGNLYVTGTQTTSFKFAGNDVEVLAMGAYIAKYDATGKELFAFALQGSITITAITTDADNNLYVAGKFADTAYVTDVEGASEEITSAEPDSQKAAFIAKYDANGKLQTVKAYEAALNADLWDPTSVAIDKVVVENGKVYLSFTFTGDVVFGEKKITAKTLNLDLDGWLMAMEFANKAVVAFDSNLDATEVVAELSLADNAVMATKVNSFDFAVEGENVYVAAFAMGDVALTTSVGTETFNFSAPDDGTSEQGAITAKIGTAAVKYSNISNTTSYVRNEISALEVKNDVMYIVGTFNDTNAFDNEKVAVGGIDVFVAAIDAANKWVYTNGYDETSDGEYSEFIGGATFNGENICVIDVLVNTTDGTFLKTNNYEVSLTGEGKEYAGSAATAVAYNDNYVALINCTDKTYINVYNTEGFATGIDEVVVEGENNAIYDLTGRRIEQVTKPGIYIVNGVKKLVK